MAKKKTKPKKRKVKKKKTKKKTKTVKKRTAPVEKVEKKTEDELFEERDERRKVEGEESTFGEEIGDEQEEFNDWGYEEDEELM